MEDDLHVDEALTCEDEDGGICDSPRDDFDDDRQEEISGEMDGSEFSENLDPSPHEFLEAEGNFCLFCGAVGSRRCLVICVSCGIGAHTYCLGPMNYQVPQGRWVCDVCEIAGVREGPRLVGRTKRVLAIEPKG